MADYLEDASVRRTVTKSSISQAKDKKLSVTNKLGQYFPLVFDHLDYIDCKKVKSHNITVSLVDEADYEYGVQNCTFYTDQYLFVDDKKVELRTLPHWFGEGFYQKFIDRNTFINFDNEALGVRNKTEVQVGLHYVEALDTLD